MALPRARMTNDRSTGVAINVKLAGIGTSRRLLRDRPLAAAYYAASAGTSRKGISLCLHYHTGVVG